MKQFLKLFSVTALTLILVGCSKKPETVEESQPAPVESVVESSSVVEESDHASNESSGAEAANRDESVTTVDPNEPVTDGVKVTIHISGEPQPLATYVVKDVDGMSVLDVMHQINELEFNFNEDEGVIDTIAGHTNDYAAEKTWAYLLNGQFAELGVVSQTLKNGDTIDWYFGTVDQIPVNIIGTDGTVTPANPSTHNNDEEQVVTMDENEESVEQ